jgi:hypothetical protein
MDNVRAGWSRPQEDEFALLTMGVRSPYRRMAFPNNPPPDLAYLNMEGIAEPELQRWCQAMQAFVRTLTFHTPKRVVLKSPTHTGRVALLARLFPGAQFIHMTRDPVALFPSTRRLWKSLDEVQGCQRARHEYLDEYVFECLLRMYDGFEKQRSVLGPTQIVDMRYEDLAADPVGVVESVYEQLQLGDYAALRTVLEPDVHGERDYQVNRHQVSDDQRAVILTRWRDYAQRYGYDLEQEITNAQAPGNDA